MPRRGLVIGSAWLMVLTLLVSYMSGCNGQSSGTPGDQTTTDDSPSHTEEPSLPPPEPLLEGWEKPALAFVFSGEQHGYLEPCGCSLTQSGGLARRADLFRKIEERDWTVTGLDLGGTVERNRRQSEIKFETILAALRDMNYEALALGPEELRLKPDYLLSQHVSSNGDNSRTLKFLGANVVFFDTPELGTPAHQKVFTIGDTKVGVTGILGDSLKNKVFPDGSQVEVTIKDPEQVLPKIIEDLNKQQPDLKILLSHARLEESRKLAQKFPEFDLVLSAGGPEDPEGKPEFFDNTMLINVGQKGKYVGVVGYYPDKPESPLKFELVDLDSQRFKNLPAMDEHMQYYQDRLRDENLAEEELPIPHPRGTKFVGAKKCGECHTKAYSKWKTTRHSHAYESLKIGREGQQEGWISRIHDPECLACHVTGWHPQEVLRYESGFLSEEKTPHLLGQQCENCHGPGNRHVELEELWERSRDQVERDQLIAQRKAMHLTTEIAQERVCYKCHDLDNSPNFKFEKYWEEVKHPWRD